MSDTSWPHNSWARANADITDATPVLGLRLMCTIRNGLFRDELVIINGTPRQAVCVPDGEWQYGLLVDQ